MGGVVPVSLVGLAVAAVNGMVVQPTASPPARTVPCDEIIDHTRFPYLGGHKPEFRYRLMLGVVSVPPAYMSQVVALPGEPATYWRYFRKQGLVVRAFGNSVSITVPKRWRKRAAISWGYRMRAVSSLRIAGCGSNSRIGNAYSGGFFLRSPAGCVPLIFRVGTRSAIVRFGLGQRCN